MLDLHKNEGTMNGSATPLRALVLRRGFERLRASAMLKQSVLVFVASMVLNVCGFIAHAVASRQLGVTIYGELYALISAGVIAALPAAFVGPVIAQLAAEFRALHDDGHLRGLLDSVAFGFAALGALYLAIAIPGAAPFARFLHVPAWSVPFVGLLAGIALFVAALRAIAQGTQDFACYSLSSIAEGVAKVFGIALLVALGWRLAGGIVGFICGPLAASIYLGLRLRRRYAHATPHRVRYDWRRILNAGAGAAAATIAIALMGSADVVLVKHFFDAHAAGLYAAASLGGKMLLYLVGFVPTVLLPQAADRHARGAQTREVLYGGLAMFALAAVAGLFIFKFFGVYVLHALVGRAFDAAAPLLVSYGTAMVMLALTNALTAYGIATHRLGFTLPLFACTFGTLGVIAVAHANLGMVVEVMVVGNCAAAVAVALALVLQRNTGKRRSTL
ncbi:MAG: oligosaccharide flippase family protein [Candidatus Eremiobacteraeota bacterium]|nr:oligosaccharide flippase family protein [Candidatus Eremiobacteraeota bacterium]